MPSAIENHDRKACGGALLVLELAAPDAVMGPAPSGR